jgi:hypothetical protein
MSLLSFRAPVQSAACHRCGNALSKGVRECPHCGALQTAIALRPHNTIDFPGRVPARMTRRMLVPYPSVPEEVETATNIARQRAQAIRRVVFGVTTTTLCAGALALAVGPSLRSPAGEQRMAALPQRDAAVPEEGPTVTADAALPSHAPGTPGPSETATTVLSVPPAPVADEFAATPSPAHSDTATVASTTSRSPAPPDVVAARAPVTTANVAATHVHTPAPTIVAAAPAVETTRLPAAAAAVAVTPSPTPTPVVASRRSHLPAPIVVAAVPPSPPVSAVTPTHPANMPTVAVAAATPSTSVASTHQPAPVITPIRQPAPVVIAATPAPMVASTHSPAPAPSIVTATATPSRPSLPTASVASASTLPASMAVIADEPKAAHSEDDALYAARLAMIANDLGTARNHLSKVAPSGQVDPEAQRIADELARRESVRDTDMQRARACDAANLLPCARRYAKAAMAIDTSYPDSQVFYKRVVYKQAVARKAAALALAQAEAAAAPHAAPIRDATPLVHYVSHGNPVQGPMVAAAPVPTPAPAPITQQIAAPMITQRSFATASARPSMMESHDIREVREVREVHEPRLLTQETRPAEPPAPAAAPAPAPAPVAEATDYSVPIMARGRGVAH